MNTKPLNIGFVGGALDSAVGTTHKLASQMDDKWSLCCGCFSTDKEMNFKTGARWGVDSNRVYENWDALLLNEKVDIDAIAVLTPTPSHKEIVEGCLDSGVPVICEKSLTSNSEDAKKLKEIERKNNGYLTVTYNYTGYPMIRELKNLIGKNLIGKLNQIHIEMPQEGFARLDKSRNKIVPQSWRLVDQSIPTLSLDLAVHLHQLIDFISGEKPKELVCLNNSFGHFKQIVDNTMCIARYSGDLDCQIWFGKTALGQTNGLRIRIFGETGSAEWYQQNPEYLCIWDNLGKKHLLDRSEVDIEIANQDRYTRFKAGHPAGFIEAFANHYYDIADSLIEFRRNGNFKNPWVFGSDIAYEGLLMLEAMSKSAKEKSWVTLER